MVGYHFTTISNWRQIQYDGLKPALITHPSFVALCPGEKGIWFWQDFLEGSELLGMLIGMLAEKRSWDVCELAVDLTGLTHFEVPNVDKLTLCTSYYVGDWKCVDEGPTWVITDPISPHRIKFNRHWCLGD